MDEDLKIHLSYLQKFFKKHGWIINGDYRLSKRITDKTIVIHTGFKVYSKGKTKKVAKISIRGGFRNIWQSKKEIKYVTAFQIFDQVNKLEENLRKEHQCQMIIPN